MERVAYAGERTQDTTPGISPGALAFTFTFTDSTEPHRLLLLLLLIAHITGYHYYCWYGHGSTSSTLFPAADRPDPGAIPRCYLWTHRSCRRLRAANHFRPQLPLIFYPWIFCCDRLRYHEKTPPSLMEFINNASITRRSSVSLWTINISDSWIAAVEPPQLGAAQKSRSGPSSQKLGK